MLNTKLLQTRLVAETVTHSPEETMAFGRALAGELEPPCLVLLEGELGTGKTTLVKGIVAGLGAAHEEEVNSPTFTLVHEYSKPGVACRVYHVDLYRIEDPRELATLGLDECFLDKSSPDSSGKRRAPNCRRAPGGIGRCGDWHSCLDCLGRSRAPP